MIDYRRCFFFILAGIVIFNGCARRVVKPPVERLTVLVSPDLTTEDLAKMANLVQMRRSEETVLWLAAGRILLDKEAVALTQGEAEISVLNAAGVDALVFTPEWLRFGLIRTKGLIDRANFRVLCSNLDDTLGLPVAHPWLIKRRVGVTAVLPDFGLLPLRLNGVKFIPASYAASRALTLLRTKADFNTLVLPAGESLHTAGYDLVLVTAKDRITCYQLTLVGGSLSDVAKTAVSLQGLEPLPEVKSKIDSIYKSVKEIADEPVVETRVKISPRVLTKAVVEGILSLRFLDAFVYDSTSFVTDTIYPGTITKGKLINSFSDPGRLVIFNLEGEEIEKLQKEPNVKVQVRKGLPLGRLMARKVYQVGTTASFVMAHPEIAVNRFELSERQLWEYAFDILQAQGRR